MQSECDMLYFHLFSFFLHRTPYAAVAQLIYGRRMHIFVTFMLNIAVFGAGIPNILVGNYICDNFSDLSVVSIFQYFSITKSTINRHSDQRWRIFCFLLLLAYYIRHIFMPYYVARESEKYEVGHPYPFSVQFKNAKNLSNSIYRAIACVSVVTVLTVSILIWICIMEDDSMASGSFSQIQLGISSIQSFHIFCHCTF